MQTLQSQKRAFEEGCYVRLAFMHIMDVVDDIISSIVLAANFRAIYIRYTTVDRMIIKHRGMIYLLSNPNRDVPGARTLGVSHLVYLSIYISSEAGISLMMQVASTFVKNGYHAVIFHANEFRGHAGALLNRFMFATRRKELINFRPLHCSLKP